MARPVTFVHTADLHLDAPFQGVDAEDPRVRTALVDSTYGALDRIVALAIERNVDFVLVAGDVYNSRDKSLRSQLRFASAMERLAEAGIAVYIAQGNHDPANGWSANMPLPETVHYFSTSSVDRIEVTDDEGARLCTLYGRGYATAATTTDLAAGYHRDAADETAIAVLHTNVGSQSGYEPYAPATLEQLRSAGMDYWALGHIHKPSDLLDVPKIRYSGSPQGLNPKEDGPHGCWVVSMDRGSVITEEFVETSIIQWARQDLDIDDISTLDELRDALRQSCDSLRGAAGGCAVIVRIDLIGRGLVHGDMARGERLAELVDELRDEQMSESPWIWIDRVRDLTRPVVDIDFLRTTEDFTGDLVRIADGLSADSATVSKFVDEALGEIDAAFGARERDTGKLIERARDLCLDRLLAEAD